MILSFRFGLSTAAILFMAAVVKFSALLRKEFTVSQVPLIWNLVVSWFEPPYLYLVINCIIITIFASSKLQKHGTSHNSELNKFLEDDYNGNQNALQSKLVEVMQANSSREIKFSYKYSDEFDLNGNADDSVTETKSPIIVKDVHIDDSNAPGGLYSGKTTSFKEINDKIILEHTVNKMSEPKPPSSGKFVHQKVVEDNKEGKGRLRVLKPKAQELDTLETTWKSITNGQPLQSTCKHTSYGNLQDEHKMILSETFNEQNSNHRIDNMSKRLAGSSGPGKLRRDPSLSQDELNKRAEAFINRFKEDMRLQRKESLDRSVETINSIIC
ncbi:hypothetical protein DCAR_0311272 [Daucus carota subsp. sativus]|uniref:DUF4408 domain-containing protein n=1 Tax=Daucus carota subsp. sativus TaxID=79200 RepID=A0A166AGW3_DAUCS|nr:PREDICTED: uncharacterized protein LOC108213588 [Daucus carota subsp. sativus]WOG92016.1 hypothetical protein DCAR_0311272 [Daucus carota subsp. sativus]